MATLNRFDRTVPNLIESGAFAGTLPKYTSLGCYPIFYVEGDDEILCAGCASDEIWKAAEDGDNKDVPAMADVNYEDPALYCDACSDRIESAYAEDDAAVPLAQG